mmetsp:Transcript_16216/g.44616  ORF Transcript_16216/g.44616 Transcript_16216/m.44616 type:complete len:1088 (-) Transcript_16216:1504-4767(-)|eukprot:CAMPEP_0168728452 /NCGR_PEP_ID=MMETSP0724-20121128/5690_1 /TAXON_ID=265536 /ORGANISM="Amphiprora sp., Strain CCMP467" /LENGTH=1087 /DNA_ID=CAMNT_0008775295 /DNA_START=291 /DNA_END=3554 /DNA_ORIENTATION=+
MNNNRESADNGMRSSTSSSNLKRPPGRPKLAKQTVDETPVNPDENNVHDVLFGRGKGATDWIGNRRYHELIRSKVPEYEALDRNRDKKVVTVEIVEIIKSRGGRFLRFVSTTPGNEDQVDPASGGGHFVLVPDNTARIKVGQALRHAMRDMNGTLVKSTGKPSSGQAGGSPQRAAVSNQKTNPTSKQPAASVTDSKSNPIPKPSPTTESSAAALATAQKSISNDAPVAGSASINRKSSAAGESSSKDAAAKAATLQEKEDKAYPVRNGPNPSEGATHTDKESAPTSELEDQPTGPEKKAEKRLTWDEMFQLLLEYKTLHGHTTPTQSETFRGQPLGSWCKYQRNLYSRLYLKNVQPPGDDNGAKRQNPSLSLSHKRIEQLNRIGFVWVTQSTGRSFQLKPKIVGADDVPPPPASPSNRKRKNHDSQESKPSPKKKKAPLPRQAGDKPTAVTRQTSIEPPARNRESSTHRPQHSSHPYVGNLRAPDRSHASSQQYTQYDQYTMDRLRQHAYQSMGQLLPPGPRFETSSLTDMTRQPRVFQTGPSGAITGGQDAASTMPRGALRAPSMTSSNLHARDVNRALQLAQAEAYVARARQKASEDYEEWMTMIHLLKQYKLERRHVCPSLAETYGGQPLGAWVHSLRTPERVITLTQMQHRHLDEIGFQWRPEQERPPMMGLLNDEMAAVAARGAVEPQSLILDAFNAPFLVDATQKLPATTSNLLHSHHQALLQQQHAAGRTRVPHHGERVSPPSTNRTYQEETPQITKVLNRVRNEGERQRMLGRDEGGNENEAERKTRTNQGGEVDERRKMGQGRNEDGSETETEEASSSSEDDDDDSSTSTPPPPSQAPASAIDRTDTASPPKNVIWTRRPESGGESDKDDDDEKDSRSSDGGTDPKDYEEERFVDFHPELDIICSQNSRAASPNPGNKRCKRIVDEYRATAPMSDKRAITRKIISEIQQSGGRFVKYDLTWKRWKEANDSDKRWKIGRELRGSSPEESDELPRKSGEKQTPPKKRTDKNSMETPNGQTITNKQLRSLISTKDPPSKAKDGPVVTKKDEEPDQAAIKSVESSQSSPSPQDKNGKVMSFF